MKKISLYIILLVVYSGFAASDSKKKEIYKKQLINNFEIQKENELVLEEGANRILQVLDAFSLFEEYFHVTQMGESFVQLLKNFFGLQVKTKYTSFYEKQFFIESLIFSIGQFNANATADLKYLCDMQIKYVLSFKSMIVEGIKKQSAYCLIVLSYYFSLFCPNQYMNLGERTPLDEDNTIVVDSIEKEINWQEAVTQMPIEFSEIGMLRDGYMYELYDEFFIKKLSSNKEYKDIVLIKKMLPDVIAQDDFALDRLIRKYQKNYNFFKEDANLLAWYEEKQEFFLMWLLEKKNIVDALDTFINDDALFFLFTTVLLYKSILKINRNDYYPLLKDDQCKDLENAAKQAEFILYEFFSIFDKKAQIKWDKMPIIVIGQQRLQDIINYFHAMAIK
jgi:hypothetical protein